MKPSLPISFHSSFLVLFLPSSTTLANPLPPPANPQLDWSSELEFLSPITPNFDFLLPQQEQQQLFPLDDATTIKSNTFLLLGDNNNEPTISPAPARQHCNTLLHPRSDDGTIEPAMCPINTEETLYPVPDWDPNEAWKEYLRKYPPDVTRVRPAEEEEGEEGNRALKDESFGTGCPDPYHQDHLCCAGPAGKIGVLSLRPNDISFIEHCALCMLGIFFWCHMLPLLHLFIYFIFTSSKKENFAHPQPRKEERWVNK